MGERGYENAFFLTLEPLYHIVAKMIKNRMKIIIFCQCINVFFRKILTTVFASIDNPLCIEMLYYLVSSSITYFDKVKRYKGIYRT